MAKINLGKFLDCLVKYKNDCEMSIWTKREISKFYFANLLARRIQLEFQSAEMIYEICNRIQEKDFYYQNNDSKICGIQFLKNTGDSSFTEQISLTDIQLFKFLAKYENLLETDFDRRNIGYQSLSGWIGTLIPHKFMPVTSGEFRETIAFLFDIKPSRFSESDYNYFTHSQKYFLLTKEKLKEFDLGSLYLDDIAEYVKFCYPKSTPKRAYNEYDWNWITQDFHLYVYREIMGLDQTEQLSVRQRVIPGSFSGVNLNKAEVLNIYVP